MRLFSILLILISTANLSCAQTDVSAFDLMLEGLLSNSVKQIEYPELKKLMQNEDILILDAREKEEFEVSHIPGARHIGYNDFDSAVLSEIPFSKPVVLYCSVGYRSEKIGEKLLDMGYENVLNLRGGIFDWKNHQNPVVDMNGKSTDKIHAYDRIWGIWLKEGEKVYER